MLYVSMWPFTPTACCGEFETVDRQVGRVCVCVNVHVSAKAGQWHAPIVKENGGGGHVCVGVGVLDDVWPGSWELLCSFVPP